MQRDIVVVILY